MITQIITSVLLLSGALFILVASIGVARLPDVYCRSHALTKAMTMGIILMLLGMWIYLGPELTGLKVILAIFFQLATIPVAGHLMGLIAYQKRLPRWRPPGATQKKVTSDDR